MYKLFVPRENVNDEEVTVLSIKFPSKSSVKEGECLFEIETSKINIDIEAPVNGIILHDLSEGDIVNVGDLLCKIDDGSDTKADSSNSIEEVKSEKKLKITVSKSALRRAEELGVDLSSLKEGMVNVSDVEKMALKNKKNDASSSEIELKDVPEIRKNSIVIIGGGGHAKMCIDILQQTNEYEILGIIDSKLHIGTDVLGVKVFGDDNILHKLHANGLSYAVNGVGSVTNPSKRKKIFDLLKEIGFFLPNLLHLSAVIEPSVVMGEGNQIMMGACIGSEVVIQDNCIVNSGAIVSHDCDVKSHSQISPGAILAGTVTVGELAVIGMGVTVYIGVTIGDKSVIHNGINVFKDVEPNTILQSN